MKPLVIIPARGGSKGVPRKNIKMLNGKPLIHYTIQAAREVFSDDLIVVSTDDEEIRSVSEVTGLKVPFLRPSELASDTTGSREVILHAIEFYEQNGYSPDVVVLLQPTSPFRKATHIQEALNLYKSDLDMVVSVKETRSNPYYILFEEDEAGFLKKVKTSSFQRRQDVPKVWELNGAIYLMNVDSIKLNSIGQFSKVVKYEMSELSSVDIDTEMDFFIADAILKSSNNNTIVL